MNHWLDASQRNLVPLSKSTSFTEALREWLFTGNVFDYDDEDIECELCEHPDLSHHFEIRNTLNDNRLLVGSSCILKFSEINIHDALGQEVTDPDERKFYLEDALRKKLTEIMLEPLRELWLKDKEYRGNIESKARYLKAGSGISPRELLFLFRRMEFYNIPYTAKRYKVSLRSYSEQRELHQMSQEDLHKIKPALSATQVKKYAHILGA
ncbi:hypothetical protein NP603_16110 [Methylomonas sp. SURF-1]|uniref:Uncharacterized protein n=1 Tax=Methylomonas aurea TaxID=2952224 RepID=A0ABT1UML6_9GAMM|nr:hypothetical protein [Methylomonas sp. SURF-1]MCQ8182646.1 hypothetical protein [Methylomonas sp. SURF-1]